MTWGWWLLVIGNHGSSFFFKKKSAFGVNFDVTMSPIRFDCDMTTTEPTMLIDPSIDFQEGTKWRHACLRKRFASCSFEPFWNLWGKLTVTDSEVMPARWQLPSSLIICSFESLELYLCPLPGCLRSTVWICSFSINQHASICAGFGAPPEDPEAFAKFEAWTHWIWMDMADLLQIS